MSGLNTGNLGSGQFMATYENNPGERYSVRWEEEGTLGVCAQGNKPISLSGNICFSPGHTYICSSMCVLARASVFACKYACASV